MPTPLTLRGIGGVTSLPTKFGVGPSPFFFNKIVLATCISPPYPLHFGEELR